MRRRFVFLPVQRLAPAVPAVVVARRRRNVTRRIGAGTALRSPKYPVEEVATAAALTSAATINADRHTHPLGCGILRPTLDRDIGDLALVALEDGEHLGIASIDILAQL